MNEDLGGCDPPLNRLDLWCHYGMIGRGVTSFGKLEGRGGKPGASSSHGGGKSILCPPPPMVCLVFFLCWGGGAFVPPPLVLAII